MMNKEIKNIYYYYGGDVPNTVLFGGFCWRIVRTTKTGGVKMVVIGAYSRGTCQLQSQIFSSAYSTSSSSISDLGYMYNKTLNVQSGSLSSSGRFAYLYSNDITYDGEMYHLSNTVNAFDYEHHYVCASNNATSCQKVRYYADENYYVELEGQPDIESAIHEVLDAEDVNKYDSKVKNFVDVWFERYLKNYEDYLEDTVFCNDRQYASNSDASSWFTNGGTVSKIPFRITNRPNPNLECVNITDRFSVSNEKAKLKYPIALLSADEVNLGKDASSFEPGNHYLNYLTYHKTYRFTMTPYVFNNNIAYISFLNSNSNNQTMGIPSNRSYYLALSISLKPGIKIKSGSGYLGNPYVIDLDE